MGQNWIFSWNLGLKTGYFLLAQISTVDDIRSVSLKEVIL
jgi:hypothetical protein